MRNLLHWSNEVKVCFFALNEIELLRFCCAAASAGMHSEFRLLFICLQSNKKTAVDTFIFYSGYQYTGAKLHILFHLVLVFPLILISTSLCVCMYSCLVGGLRIMLHYICGLNCMVTWLYAICWNCVLFWACLEQPLLSSGVKSFFV